jgi:intracellular septation protein
MRLLFDFFPLLLFFAAFKLYGIYIATAVAIIATVVQVAWHWLRTRRVEATHVTTLAVLIVLGGLTLAFHDDTFIRWKPTIVYVVLAALLFASQLTGDITLLERLLSRQILLPAHVWRRLNSSWGWFFLALGALNLYVAFYYDAGRDPANRLALWVNFKVFGLTGLTAAFVLVQALVMAKYGDKPTPGEEES